MQIQRLNYISLLVLGLALAAPGTAFAQDGADSEKTEPAKEEAKATDAAATDEKAEGDEKEEEEEEETRESEHGSYEWKSSYGGGLELGLWFTGLDRWDTQLLEPNNASPYDIFGLYNIDGYFEASLLEKTRISIFGGIQTPFSQDPSAFAYYLGIEPAFAFRRDMWEIAVGAGVGFGAVQLETESQAQMDAGLIVARPFIEVRRYLNEWMGVYGRFGFNHWFVEDPEFDGLVFTRTGVADGPEINDENLNEGGAYLALGVRFGSYPEHVKNIGDADNDTYRDDVDECPEEPEDFDKFEDEDGCPEADNDKDGILDAVDQCPLDAEDKDGWQDEDGCPETDDDSDGDGLLNSVDKCPNEAEDKDGFQDEDGCPEADNDNDGILDADDKCPNKAGVPQKQGCPFEKVQITLHKIVISDKVYFAYNKADIKKESFQLLTDVADTIKAYPRIKKLEIQGHTDHAGSAKYNEDLSSKRAASVMQFLVDKGVEPERLTSKGYGFSKPVVPLPEDGKETDEGAEQNRRVEFVIVEQESVVKTVREDKVPENATQLAPEGTVKPDASGNKMKDVKGIPAAKPE